MHALQQFIQEEMNSHVPPWTQAELVRASGLPKQNISKLLNSNAERMTRMLEDPTIDGLVRALDVDANFIRLKVVEAMGVDINPPVLIREVRVASNEVLLEELHSRLEAADLAKR